MVALRGFALSKDSNAYFTHGVASGDPLKDRVILWTRVIPGDGFDRGLDVEWQVAAELSHGLSLRAPAFAGQTTRNQNHVCWR